METTLLSFFRRRIPLDPGDLIVVAFSGGPDSLALLLGLTRIAPSLGIKLHAAHFDHGWDSGSAERARRAAVLAAQLGVSYTCAGPGEATRGPGESREAAGRRRRYAFLEDARRLQGGRWVASAHHLDDQAETVLLRLLFGSGLRGLGAIQPVRGTLVRPLLDLPRAALGAFVLDAGLRAVDDPSNRDLRVPRNRLRHCVLPSLVAVDSAIVPRLSALSAASRSCWPRLDARLERWLEPQCAADQVSVEWERLAALPEPLRNAALDCIRRLAGAPHPASAAARRDLLRRAAGPGRIGCDAGSGWRWRREGSRLSLRPFRQPPATIPPFTYTLLAPGRLEIPELGVRLSLRRAPLEPWMFARDCPQRETRAALELPFGEQGEVEVRNRRPGDRIQPLGAPGARRLKEVLIDRRVPREERDRLPLLCVGGRIAWVPGVTVDETFRLSGQTSAWVAEIETQ